MKPMLIAPGIKRLKVKYYEPLLNFAFKFNLRRYKAETKLFEPLTWLGEVCAV